MLDESEKAIRIENDDGVRASYSKNLFKKFDGKQ